MLGLHGGMKRAKGGLGLEDEGKWQAREAVGERFRGEDDVRRESALMESICTEENLCNRKRERRGKKKKKF